ncbi:MAG: DUF1450 domain-containing protein [Bacillaceae bacterium]|nr:DUF1450 domain-containing protein [Bacillaceae bacterium]
MKVMIEFCQSNLAAGAEETRKRLEKDPDLDIETLDYGCLGNCGECFINLYAMVDGEIVSGEDADDLYENIKKHLAKKQDEQKQLDELLKYLDD